MVHDEPQYSKPLLAGHLKRQWQEVERRPTSSVKHLIWNGNAGPTYVMSNFLHSSKEAAPEMNPSICSACPSSSVGL